MTPETSSKTPDYDSTQVALDARVVKDFYLDLLGTTAARTLMDTTRLFEITAAAERLATIVADRQQQAEDLMGEVDALKIDRDSYELQTEAQATTIDDLQSQIHDANTQIETLDRDKDTAINQHKRTVLGVVQELQETLDTIGVLGSSAPWEEPLGRLTALLAADPETTESE